MTMDQKKNKVIGMCSGGFAPLHKGHLHYLQEAATRCDYLIVAVNGDQFLMNKHGYVFMPEDERCEIVNELKCVDMAFIFHPSDPSDQTVSDALKQIRPNIFFKGGDRLDKDSIPEWDLCQQLGIDIQIAGTTKENSSTDIIKKFKNLS